MFRSFYWQPKTKIFWRNWGFTTNSDFYSRYLSNSMSLQSLRDLKIWVCGKNLKNSNQIIILIYIIYAKFTKIPKKMKLNVTKDDGINVAPMTNSAMDRTVKHVEINIICFLTWFFGRYLFKIDSSWENKNFSNFIYILNFLFELLKECITVRLTLIQCDLSHLGGMPSSILVFQHTTYSLGTE